MLNRFCVTLTESWHVDRPAIPPIVPNIKSKSYLNLLQECDMESHQLKEWSYLIFPSGYPSALLGSGAQRTRNLPAAVTQLSSHSSTGHLHQMLLYRPDFNQSGGCSHAGAGGLSLQSIRQLLSLERTTSCTIPWQRSAGQHRHPATASREDPFTAISLANWKAQDGLWKTNSCPLACLSALPHQGKAQHSDELCVYICHTRPEGCTAHTWMGTTKGHLQGDSALPHAWTWQGAGQGPPGERARQAFISFSHRGNSKLRNPG